MKHQVQYNASPKTVNKTVVSLKKEVTNIPYTLAFNNSYIPHTLTQ